EQDPFYVIRCPNVDLIIIDSSLIVDHWGYIDDDTQDALFEKWFVSNDNSPEPSWLERQLEKSDKTFKVVFMHVPPIVFAGHYTNWTDPDKGRDLSTKRFRLLDLLAKYDVSLVLSGHQHSYEHNTLNRIGDRHLDRDMHFVVTGGAGSPLHPGLDADKIAKLESEYRSHGLGVVSQMQYVAYNFCVVRTGSETMSIDVYEVPDRESAPAELIDQVIIEGPAR
ncbi:MAG: metallophosphoesterase, partial [bacterium]